MTEGAVREGAKAIVEEADQANRAVKAGNACGAGTCQYAIGSPFYQTELNQFDAFIIQF